MTQHNASQRSTDSYHNLSAALNTDLDQDLKFQGVSTLESRL